jgi:tRNA A37 N6-isopentenylltransferase MiaA
LQIGLIADDKYIEKKIEQRVTERFREKLKNEIAGLLKNMSIGHAVNDVDGV